MRFLLILALLGPCLCTVSTAQNCVPSMQELYRPKDTDVGFSYDSLKQTLKFYGKWDFDGDGKNDTLLWTGNGGAHLYFHPILALGGGRRIGDIEWVQVDLPVLCPISELQGNKQSTEVYPAIVVHDFDGDGQQDIYINYDARFTTIPIRWRKHGLSSHRILISLKNSKPSIVNYKE